MRNTFATTIIAVHYYYHQIIIMVKINTVHNQIKWQRKQSTSLAFFFYVFLKKIVFTNNNKNANLIAFCLYFQSKSIMKQNFNVLSAFIMLLFKHDSLK